MSKRVKHSEATDKISRDKILCSGMAARYFARNFFVSGFLFLIVIQDNLSMMPKAMKAAVLLWIGSRNITREISLSLQNESDSISRQSVDSELLQAVKLMS